MTQTVSIDINSQLLASAQSYSKKMGSDLSHFIEVLLYQVIPTSTKENIDESIKPIEQLSPFVQSLCGANKDYSHVEEDLDGDVARLEYLLTR